LWRCLIRYIAVGCFTMYKEYLFGWWSMHHIGKQFVVLRKLLFHSQTPKGACASLIKYKARSHTILNLTGKLAWFIHNLKFLLLRFQTSEYFALMTFILLIPGKPRVPELWTRC
jgi:hypothetical protein